MSILHPILQFAQSQPIIAPQRRRNLLQPEFYSQDQQQVSQSGGLPQQMSSEDFITQQLQKIKEKSAPPQLQPGSRVKNIDPSVADPSNFTSFYSMLQSIGQVGKEQLAAAQAQAALARLKASQAIGNSIGQAAPTSAGGGNYGKAGSASLPSNPKQNFQYAQSIAGNYGWNSPGELAAWYQLGMKESGWNNNAQNPTSTAYGIGQFLDSTWGGYGIPKTSDPAQQVEAMARYIKARYGSPSRALAFHLSHN